MICYLFSVTPVTNSRPVAGDLQTKAAAGIFNPFSNAMLKKKRAFPFSEQSSMTSGAPLWVLEVNIDDKWTFFKKYLFIQEPLFNYA